MNSHQKQSKVLVGITTRNRAPILPKAIASALAQDYSHIQVAVLDDGSTDNTPALRPQFPGVRWERHETSWGIIESRNYLMSTAIADYYVSLDDDAWFLHGDEIALAVARMEENPGLAAIAFDILSPDRPEAVERSAPRNSAMFIGCGHMLRLSAVRDADYYAPTPGTYGSEEKDLALRLVDLDYGIEILPGVHVWHDKAWTGRDWFPLHRSGVCNELVMTLRRCPAPDVLVVLPLKIVSYAWFWLHKPRYLHAGLAGVLDFLRHGRYALHTRRPVKRSTFWRMTRGGD
jgi:glycosyltransferase involved in cell wall biosynthesis